MNEENIINKLIQDDMIEKARNEQNLYKHIFIYNLTPLLTHFKFSKFLTLQNQQILSTCSKEELLHLDEVVTLHITETLLSSTDGLQILLRTVDNFIDDITTLLYEKYNINLSIDVVLISNINQVILDYINMFRDNLMKITMFNIDMKDNIFNGDIHILENLDGKFKLEDLCVSINHTNENMTGYFVIAYYFNYPGT